MIIITYIRETFSDPGLPVSDFRLWKSESSFLKSRGFWYLKFQNMNCRKASRFSMIEATQLWQLRNNEVQEMCYLLIIRTRDFSRHSKVSITTVSVYDLFSFSFFSTMMKKYSSMLLLLAISSLSATSMHGRVHKTASVYFVCKLSKAYCALHMVCSKQGEIRSSIAVTGDLVFQKRYFHHCLLKDCSESC